MFNDWKEAGYYFWNHGIGFIKAVIAERFIFLRSFLPLSLWCLCLILSFTPTAWGEPPTPSFRVVSLSPNLTEIIFALGGQSHLVAVTNFCNYPPEVQNLPKIGDLLTPNVEAILAYRPHWVISAGNGQELFPKLNQAGIETQVFVPASLQELYGVIQTIGRKLKRTAQAEALIKYMADELNSIREKTSLVPPKKVLILIGLEPMIALGSEPLLNEILTLAGGLNPLASSPMAYPAISREALISLRPDLIVVISQEKDNQALNDVNIPSVAIDPDWLSRPGPRLVLGARALVDALYPQFLKNE